MAVLLGNEKSTFVFPDREKKTRDYRYIETIFTDFIM